MKLLLEKWKKFLVEAINLVCPPATQDLGLNTKNRDSAIQAEHIQYGPMNLEDESYWVKLAKFWKTEPEVAKESKCSNCAAFDINLGCSGFPYALSVVSSMLENHICSKALIICSDTYTKYIKKDNRACRPLFSDAAAAIIVSKSKDSKIGPFIFGTDGSGAENLIVRNSASNIENGVEKTLYMNGAEVLLFTMSNVPKGITKLVKDSGLNIEDIDMFFLHQASKIVMSNIQRILKVPDSKFPTNFENHGNTVSATIPILMAQEAEKGNLQRGMTILLFGFGVGYSYGGCIVEY